MQYVSCGKQKESKLKNKNGLNLRGRKCIRYRNYDERKIKVGQQQM
jgi:hypothetical protein